MDKFEVEYIGYSNFSIYQRELFPYEKLTIKVNDKFIYNYKAKRISYWSIKYYKLPSVVKKIEIKSTINGRVILNKTFVDSIEKNKQLVITTPFPKNFKDSILPIKGFGELTVKNSERNIYIKYY
jgi:hypothetical protein